MAACVSRADAELRHGRDGRIEPDLGVRGDLLHRPQRRGDEPGDRVGFASSVDCADDEPVAGQRHDVVDAQDRDLLPGQLELDRLVVGEPGRGIHRALGDRRSLAEVGVLDDLDVVGREVRRSASSAWSMIHDEP